MEPGADHTQLLIGVVLMVVGAADIAILNIPAVGSRLRGVARAAVWAMAAVMLALGAAVVLHALLTR